MRFAPNFSVFVLPPDVVCLYSEDRKFFLHGELYCALASAIGSGKDRPQDVLRALKRDYPADKVDEAFGRLVDRRFVVRMRAGDGTIAAYWASLGLPPETAAENLQKVRVRVQPLGGAGGDELQDALRELGVRLVNRGAADLIVVPVSDYLDARLAEFNARQLKQGQDWLPVQTSGIFPLVGPIFSPRQTACWTCLAERMKWNRQVKAFLERADARCVSASPLTGHTVGQSGVGLAALEIAKAIASGFRTDLPNHLVSLDLLGSSVVRHYVPRRPQCPSCGQKRFRDPKRTPLPIELRDGGGPLVMTSGGYRGVSPGETVARNRKHVSALTGVVSHLQRIATDLPLNASFLAKHNFSPRPNTVEALKQGLIGDSYGKGSTAEQAEASALMEAIERYSGIFQGNEIRTTRRFGDFPAGEAIHPNEMLLLSDAQYERAAAPMTCGHEHPHEHDESCGHAPAQEVFPRFDTSVPIEWSPAWSLRDGRFRYFPTSLMYFHHRGPGDDQLHADSNGCASGNTLEEAIVQGFLELVERDSYAIWWYNRLYRGEVDIDALDDPYIRDLKAAFAATGRQMWVLDITSDLGIPSVVAIGCVRDGDREHIEYGSGAHFDLRIATLRAVTELNQCLAIGGMAGAREADIHGDDPLPLERHPYMLPQGKAVLSGNSVAKFGAGDRRAQVLACVDAVKAQGLDFLVLDQTRPDIEVPVVRVIVPGMRHYYRRFAPGRLYDVPVKLGWLKRPVPEAELNPLHPRT